MLRNYLKTAIRSFLRQKSYTFLNISGLTVGVACSLLIYFWVGDERGIDNFHENDQRLYQILRNMHLEEEQILTTEAVPQPVKVTLEEEYPEIDKVTLIGWETEFLFKKNNQVFKESGRYVSPQFIEIFSYPLLSGDRETALDDINGILISENLAVKYFGTSWKDSNILGSTIEIDNNQELTIQGVFVNPANSSLEFDWLRSAQAYIKDNSWVENWSNGGFRMAFTFVEGVNVADFAKKIEQEINKHTNDGSDERLVIQRYSERYLNGTYENGVQSSGRIDNVRILTIVAIFILVIACINFMNLATARSVRRAQEIGLRKVMGARKVALSLQFLTESMIMSFVSVVLSIGIVYVVLPYFNEISGKFIVMDFSSPDLWLGVVTIILVTGILSGSYPALLLPSFKITSSLKGTLKHSKGSTFFRKGLVVFQFAISILLIIGTITVYNQMDYIMSKNIGVNKDNLVFVELENETAERFETYKTELLRIPEVLHVTSTSGNPLSYGRSSSSPSWDGKDPDMNVEMNIMMVSQDFIETMDMKMLAGRDFSEDYGTDSANYVINEEAARIMGFENPVGERLSCWGIDGQIIGLVKNFHMSSLYNPIEPLVIRYDPPNTFMAFIRIQGDTKNALLAIEQVTRDMNPAYPFHYAFLDEEYENAYRSEQTISSLSNIFAAMAIFISCLGLFGLSSYSAEQRTKELGIRKIHGANISRLILLLTKDYTLLIVLAFLIASPIAWYFANGWLDKFAYRTDLGIGVFIASGIAATLIAALTVSFKSYQAASANPVETLKEE